MTSRRTVPATYLCGGPEDPGPRPCPAGGADHTPFPAGYGAHAEYSAQLLHTGWTCHRCHRCRLWTIWRPDQPQPQPPMRPRPDGEPWELPCPAPDCDICLEDEEWDDDAPNGLDGVVVLRGRPVETLTPLEAYL